MNSGVSELVRPLPPNRNPDRSLKARQHTTTSATPVATAIAACTTVPAAAPPPCGTREKKLRSPMPTLRATSISSLASMVKVTMPVGGRQARFVERGTDCLTRQLQLAAPGFLGELGLTDSRDRAAAGQRAAHAPAPSSRLRIAVPETWSPRLLEPLNVTSTKFSPSWPSVLAVTLPVKRRGSSGKHGTPRRIDRFLTIASGPAQSVRKRTQYPLVVRMFMNRLGEPCLLA